MKKTFKFILITLLVIIALVVLAAGSLATTVVIQGMIQEKACYTEQSERLNTLSTSYTNHSAIKVDESAFCDFDISRANEYKYNRLRTLGSHNSYKKKYSKSAEFLTKIAFPIAGMPANESDYYHENTTDQLNMGLRTFEYDIAVQSKKDKIVVQHAAFMDGNSWAIDFAGALQEIKMWSDYNANHMPITILLEAKESFLLNPATKKMTADNLPLLEKIIADNLGNSLYTPADMLGSNETFKALRDTNSFPTLDKMLGKVILILHPGELANSQINANIRETRIFTMSGNPDRTDTLDESENVLFLIDNTPTNGERIRINVAKGFIVRTRIDCYLDHEDDNTTARVARYNGAIYSNAQILSSDYIPRVTPIPDQYVCTLPKGKTMALTSL